MNDLEIKELIKIIEASLKAKSNSKDLELALGIIEENIEELKNCKSLSNAVGKLYLGIDIEFDIEFARWYLVYKKFYETH